MRYIYPARPQPKRKAHPMVLVAAASVIFFSLAGAAAALGYQPLAQSAAYNCSTAKVFESKLQENTNAVNRNVSGSNDTFDSEMPSIGNSRDDKQEFDVIIVKS